MKKKRLIKIYLCKTCALPIHYYTAFRGSGLCRKCFDKIDLPIVYICKNCTNIINYRTAFKKSLCRPCVNRGKNNPMFGRIGKSNPNWKSGITSLARQIRGCFKYRLWRSDVFTRDDFMCQICSVRGGNLEADHYPKQFSAIFHENKIKNLQQALDCAEFWNINNGRTLCKKCHNKTKRK